MKPGKTLVPSPPSNKAFIYKWEKIKSLYHCVTAKYCFVLLVGFAIIITDSIVSAEQYMDTLPMSSHLRRRYTDDLTGLMERRYIRVLTTFNKTNFFLSGSQTLGFEYSLLKDYEKYLNKGIKRNDLKVVLEFIPVSHDRLVLALANGLGDIAAAGLTITPQRLKEVGFVNPYLSGVDEIIVANKGVRGLRTIKDLGGREVFVRQSSSYYSSLLLLNKRLVQEKTPRVRIIKAEENLETEDILELVNSGALLITVSDSHIAKIWSGTFENLVVYSQLKLRSGGKIAWMVRKENPELKRSLNTFVKTHKNGTLLGNIYFNRYYKSDRWIKNPLSSGEQKKLHRYNGLFQKYASMYGFDWMLLKAVAYQESRLDQNKKSPSGAIGIMQIMPKTAADKNIAIYDINLPENNIHASTKYLAFLRDRYFIDAGLRDKDRVRFTLAAYNAGPAKIIRTRKLAGKMGLDRNRWFRNVEMAALRLIGQETVNYVSNINKYYVLFRLAFENENARILEKKKVIGD